MKKQILVVEDNDMNMELTTEILECQGYEVSQATRAEDGIALARERPFDLILMDVSLPGMDGLAAARILRDFLPIGRPPIVALTAHAMRGDEERARQAGCDGYISKPIDLKAFIVQISELLQEEQTNG